MQFSNARSQSDVNFDPQPWCVSVAEWFHRHGVAWSGTPSELAAQLSSAGVISQEQPSLVDSNELVAALEANADGLREQGVDISVQRIRDRVRSVSLRWDGARGASTTEGIERAVADGQDSSEIVDASDDLELIKNGADAVGEVADQSVIPDSGTSNEFATIQLVTEDQRSVLPMAVAALIALVALGLVLGFTVNRNGAFASPVAQQSEADTAAPENRDAGAEKASARDTPAQQSGSAAQTLRNDVRANASQSPSATSGGSRKRGTDGELERQLHEATKGRVAASQYEVGMRYAEGRGVTTDKIAAYAWLVVALNNGETRSEVALQSLTPNLSALEIQKIRMTLGEWYAQGQGVPKDLVAAYKWFALAEVAGSAEGTVRKRALEAEMTSTQIEQAEENTTAWLSRH